MKAALLVLFLCLVAACRAATQTKYQQQQQQQQSRQQYEYDTRASRRERNLDHWDADTLAFYLGIDESTGEMSSALQYPGHDAAVLFYAQWCQNCHALAPTWDAIATHLKAGTVASKLIMAVFDCEYNVRHMQLCTAAGVLHYPTLMFIGDGVYHDSDVISRTLLGKKRSAGPAGPSPIPHTVKFQGQWQYADSILDWIRLMQGFSRWHRWTSKGLLKHLRNGILGILPLTKRTSRGGSGGGIATTNSLPIGVPSLTPSGTSVMSSSFSGGAANQELDSDEQVALLHSYLKQSQEDHALMEKAAAHSSLLLDALLVPPTNKQQQAQDDDNATSLEDDAFYQLNVTHAWDNTSQAAAAAIIPKVLWSCVLELSLDYCSRVSAQVTNGYLQEMENKTGDDFPSMPVIESLLKDRIVEREPYCGLYDECLATDFAADECKPTTCPFRQDVACRYVNACLDPSIQREYAIGLGLIEEGDEFPPPPSVSQQATEGAMDQEPNKGSSGGGKKKRAWGF